MAAIKLCAAPNCCKVATHVSWCNSHYQRWKRYGDPLAGRVAPGEVFSYFEDTVLKYEGSDCLIWPFARYRNGYGMINIGGRPRVVSNLVCRQIHGDPPTSSHESAHSCGRGHEGCVAKNHLSWKTRAENSADRLVHGTHHRGEKAPAAKLSQNDIRIIRSLKGVSTLKEIASVFHVSESQISMIHSGKRWGWLPD